MGVSARQVPLEAAPYGSGAVFDGEEADEEEEDAVPVVSSGSSIASPSTAAASAWAHLVQLPVTRPAQSGAARRQIRRWGGEPGSSPFSLPKQDPCLHTAFAAFSQRQRPLADLASSSISSSGAAGHAVSSALASINEVISSFRQYAADPDWAGYFSPLADRLEWEGSSEPALLLPCSRTSTNEARMPVPNHDGGRYVALQWST